MNALDDVISAYAVGQLGNNFRFRKYGTGAADRSSICCLCVKVCHLIQCRFQNSGHNFQETTCTCCTFIIHKKLPNATFAVQSDCFRILTADINDGACSGYQVINTFCMAADFADLFVSAFKSESAIAGYNQIRDVFSGQAAYFVSLFQSSLGTRRTCSDLNNFCGHNVFPIFQDNNLGRSGTNVNTHCVHVLSSFDLYI